MPESKNSAELYRRACEAIPGGVNSPVRAFKAVGGEPPFIRAAKGCHIWDEDGNRRIDYVGSWGPMILGHAHPEVVEAVARAARSGTSFGAPTRAEVELAEEIRRFFPSIEKVRLVNSGTEATMSALRLARGFTGRPLIVKFDGCYHGHSDGLLVQAGSGVATFGLADSAGVPAAFAECTLSLPFNDLNPLEDAFRKHPGRIAAVILEPVTGNMGVVQPRQGFLEGVLRLCEDNGAAAIFDEVMTGFRVASGGAQGRFGLQPPLTCLGKILGGGLPLAAYGGRRDIMDRIAPEGPVYQAGTLSGNPVAVAAGLKTLRILRREDPYAVLEERTQRLCAGLRQAAAEAGIPLRVQSCGSMFTAFFTDAEVVDFATAKASDTGAFARFFRKLLDRGAAIAPSQFEACFLSISHTDEIIEETLAKCVEAL